MDRQLREQTRREARAMTELPAAIPQRDLVARASPAEYMGKIRIRLRPFSCPRPATLSSFYTVEMHGSDDDASSFYSGFSKYHITDRPLRGPLGPSSCREHCVSGEDHLPFVAPDHPQRLVLAGGGLGDILLGRYRASLQHQQLVSKTAKGIEEARS